MGDILDLIDDWWADLREGQVGSEVLMKNFLEFAL